PAEEHQPDEDQRHHDDEGHDEGVDALERRIRLLALVVLTNSVIKAPEQLGVKLDADARGAERLHLSPAAVLTAVGNLIRGNDLAADLGAADLDVLEGNAGVVGLQDLDELAVAKGDISGFAVEEPETCGEQEEEQEYPQGASEPGMTTVFASFLHRAVLL